MPSRRFVSGSILTFALVVAAVSAGAAETLNYSADADRAAVENMIGDVRVVSHDGSEFELEVTIHGRDATPGTIRVEADDGAAARWRVVFPTGEHRRYVYPALGRNGKTRFDADGRHKGFLGRLFGTGSITVSGRGSGLEVWADVVVRVPRGGRLDVHHGVGAIDAVDVEGDLDLSIHSGSISAENVRGNLVADSGAGAIRVNGIDGDLAADTGSGSVDVADCVTRRMSIDTGSGRVNLANVETGSLSIDTGSGRVDAERVRADSVSIDTGSGSVSLELEAMGSGKFVVDTGSGSVTLGLPSPASARIYADTGSGGIDIDLPDYELVHRERDEAELVVGGGTARVELDTGSGSIRIRETS